MCKFYLDTSAIITILDKKDKQHQDAIIFYSLSQTNKISLYFSSLTKEELKKNEYKYLESELKSLLKYKQLNFKFINYENNKKLHQEIINLAMYYQSPVPRYNSKKLQNDAMHAALASIAQIPLIISTNFKDLVNNEITNAIHEGNIKAGYNQFTQILDFREYNLNFNKNDFSIINQKDFPLQRFNTKYNQANHKIKLSKDTLEIAEIFYMDSNYYQVTLKCKEALYFIMEADAIIKNNPITHRKILLKEIKSNFMEGEINTNTQFYNFHQQLTKTANNFKKIPLKEIESQIKYWLIETNIWINIYSNYQKKLSIEQATITKDINQVIKEDLKKKNIPLIRLTPQ